jgi:hypothetical protein
VTKSTFSGNTATYGSNLLDLGGAKVVDCTLAGAVASGEPGIYEVGTGTFTDLTLT